MDDQVVGFAHKIGLKRVLDLVTVALARFDPEQAARRAKAARDGRGVQVGDETHDGTRTIRIEADALDVAEFDATITAIADALAGLGNTDRTDLRRATAIGVIADPQATLDLLHPRHQTAPSHEADDPGGDERAPRPGQRSGREEARRTARVAPAGGWSGAASRSSTSTCTPTRSPPTDPTRSPGSRAPARSWPARSWPGWAAPT